MAYAGVNSLIKRLGIGSTAAGIKAANAAAVSGISNMASNTNSAIREKFAAMAEGIIKSKQFVKGLGGTGVSEEPGSWKGLLLKIGIALLIVSILAVVIHYTITPVFKLRPGNKGIVSLVPLIPDATHEVFWKTPGDVAPIKDGNTILGGTSSATATNYSICADILINDAFVSVGENRIVLFRSETTEPKKGSVKSSIQDQLPRFNFALYLDPTTNDMTASIMTSAMNVDSVVFSNIPVGTPFRIGLVIADGYLEGYFNGELVNTATFNDPPLPSLGNIVPMQGDVKQLGGILNLQLWNRILQPAEMREAYPALAKKEEFKVGARPNSNICLSELGEGIPDVSDVVDTVSSTANKVSETAGAVRS